MNFVFFQFAVSILVVVISGIYLAHASDTIAEITGVGRMIIGSILLAGATSLPELFIDISAIQAGLPDLAVGDLFGSCLMNLLILAVADLTHDNPKKIFSRHGIQHSLAGAISINVTSVAMIFLFLATEIPPMPFFKTGIGPVAIGFVYILGLRLTIRDQEISTKNTLTRANHRDPRKLFKAVFKYLACACAIFIAAPYVAKSGGDIARITGLGDSFIGSTLLAFSTSLPEAVSTLTAIRLGALDLAVGNIFGSNTFNMLLLLPLDWVHQGDLFSAVSQAHLLTGLSVILATSVAIMGQLYQREKRGLIDPDAIAIIAIVFASLIILYWSGMS